MVCFITDWVILALVDGFVGVQEVFLFFFKNLSSFVRLYSALDKSHNYKRRRKKKQTNQERQHRFRNCDSRLLAFRVHPPCYTLEYMYAIEAAFVIANLSVALPRSSVARVFSRSNHYTIIIIITQPPHSFGSHPTLVRCRSSCTDQPCTSSPESTLHHSISRPEPQPPCSSSRARTRSIACHKA